MFVFHRQHDRLWRCILHTNILFLEFYSEEVITVITHKSTKTKINKHENKYGV